MALTKSKGNMYPWVTHTWNPIKGHCEFECPYCYVKSLNKNAFDRWYGVPCYLEEKELATNLGKDRMIFVGSMVDMWGPWVKDDWIEAVLVRCLNFFDNGYVFQSKNPSRFFKYAPYAFKVMMETKPIYLGTTIETDKYPEGFKTNAPPIKDRFRAMRDLEWPRKFVTIEPIMDFNLTLVEMIFMINPEFVTIGADSKGHGLIEPSWRDVQMLIKELNKFTEIRQKTNLERLKK
jgi:DNA repair photolyase